MQIDSQQLIATMSFHLIKMTFLIFFSLRTRTAAGSFGFAKQSQKPSWCMQKMIVRNPRHVVGSSTVDLLRPRRSSSLRAFSEEVSSKVPAKFQAFPFDYHQLLEVRIQSLTNRGWGIARVDLERHSDADLTLEGEEQPPSKWVVMVPNVIPGELVRVSIFRNFRNYSEADLVHVIEPSEDRIEPKCPLSAECGGCQLQHMNIESQRKWKTIFVRESLSQFNIEAHVEPTLGTKEIFGYRSKLTPHFQQPSSRRRGKIETKAPSISAIGFQKQTSREIIDVPECPIATNPINEEYKKVRHTLLSQPTDRKKGATLLFRQGNANDEAVCTNHKEYITTAVNHLNFTYLAGNFFQNNYYVLPLMVEQVIQKAIGDGGITHLADCYCGSGLFAISAASHFDCVVGIEINDKAIEEATRNAEANHITNCRFLAASAENIFQEIQDFPRESTAVVLDPPRKGCSEEFLLQLFAFSPKRIVYMSCDPTTQARDARHIIDDGYSVTHVQPFDLFPQTRHIECLMIFDRDNSPAE